MVLSFLDALDTFDRGLPSEQRHLKAQQRPVSLPSSRNNSTTSINSLRSEPGRSSGISANSVSSNASSKSSGGFSKFFSKSKKEKKDTDKKQVITSRHSQAAAIAAKMALDLKYKQAHPGLTLGPRLVGTQSTPNITITPQEQELRHPHSGPPALIAPLGRTDMPVLTRVISGDEADDPDEFERMRDDWRQRMIPDVQLVQVLEGTGIGSGSSSGTTTPQEKEAEKTQIPASKVIEREGVRLLSIADAPLDARPKPVRRHTPIGGRFKKDENGKWKR
jgi:hypothetical protein